MRKESTIDLQAFYPDCLKVTEVVEDEHGLVVHLKSQKHIHACPRCNAEMNMYHGTYRRRVQDLPICGKQVKLEITAYEYFCTNPECVKRTFTENYGGFIGRCERMTDRLEDFIVMLALETNCEGAAAICKAMGISISGDTIINMLRRLAEETPPASCGDSIGVDDFAYRKGQKYCTVVCDESTHKPIAILEGRDGISLQEWLKNNKHIKKVSRDRAGAYAKAIAEELPSAIQVADRFHLHQNLLQAIKEALRQSLPNQIPIPNRTESIGTDDTTADSKKNATRGSDRSRTAPL